MGICAALAHIRLTLFTVKNCPEKALAISGADSLVVAALAGYTRCL